MSSSRPRRGASPDTKTGCTRSLLRWWEFFKKHTKGLVLILACDWALSSAKKLCQYRLLKPGGSFNCGMRISDCGLKKQSFLVFSPHSEIRNLQSADPRAPANRNSTHYRRANFL